MVFGIASMATAGLSIYVNGAPAESSSITLLPSDFIMLGIYSDGLIDNGRYSGALVLDPGDTGVWPAVGNYTGVTANNSTLAGSAVFTTGGPDGIFIQTNGNPADTLGPGLWSEFEFHCNGQGNILVQIMDDAYGLGDSLNIRLVPEPATMALLGLGMLILPRRRA